MNLLRIENVLQKQAALSADWPPRKSPGHFAAHLGSTLRDNSRVQPGYRSCDNPVYEDLDPARPPTPRGHRKSKMLSTARWTFEAVLSGQVEKPGGCSTGGFLLPLCAAGGAGAPVGDKTSIAKAKQAG